MIVRISLFCRRSPAASGRVWRQATESKAHNPQPPEPTMRQERTVQASIFDLFAGHEIGRELKAMSAWLDDHRELSSLVGADLCQEGVKATGRWSAPLGPDRLRFRN